MIAGIVALALLAGGSVGALFGVVYTRNSLREALETVRALRSSTLRAEVDASRAACHVDAMIEMIAYRPAARRAVAEASAAAARHYRGEAT